VTRPVVTAARSRPEAELGESLGEVSPAEPICGLSPVPGVPLIDVDGDGLTLCDGDVDEDGEGDVL
jgi:hypothetical protein